MLSGWSAWPLGALGGFLAPFGTGHQVMAIPSVFKHQAALPFWDLAAPHPPPAMLLRETHFSNL